MGRPNVCDGSIERGQPRSGEEGAVGRVVALITGFYTYTVDQLRCRRRGLWKTEVWR